MAQIEKRQYDGGKTTRWRVKWRVGGTGKWDGQQFDYQADAKRFKPLVDAAGNHRSSPEQLVEHGFSPDARRGSSRQHQSPARRS